MSKVIVVETWRLGPGLGPRAAEVMQEMDDLLGPAAHDHPGWCGHARFLQDADRPEEVLVIYPWRSRVLHEDLTRAEEPRLGEFYARRCAAPRTIRYSEELSVDVDHDHETEQGGRAR